MEEEYKRLLEEIRDGYFLIQDGRMVMASNYLMEASGYSRDEITGMPFTELIAPEQRERIAEFYENRISGLEVPQRYETVLLRKDGTSIPAEMTVWLTHFQGRPATAGIVMDITERKQVDQELRETEERFFSAFHQNPTAMSISTSLEGRNVDVNDSFLRMFEYSREEVIGRTSVDLNLFRGKAERDETVQDLLGTNDPIVKELVLSTKTGKQITALCWAKEISINGQKHIISMAVDITERKRIMEELQDSEERYRSIVENSPYLIYTADTEGKVLTVNKASRDVLGYEPEDVIGMNFMDFIPREEEAMSRAMGDHNRLTSGSSVESSILSITKDGVDRIIEFISAPIFKDGEVIKAQGMVFDITDRKLAEEKLKRIFESVPDGVTVTDLNGVITEISERTVELHGYASKDEILGKSAFRFIAKGDHKRAVENVNEILEKGLVRNIEYRLLRKDVSEFSGELSASILKDAFGKPMGFIAITRDITDRKETEEKYRQLLDDMNDGYEVIQDGEIVFANRRLCDIFGYEPGQMTGMPISQKFAALESPQTAVKQYEEVMHGKEGVPRQHEVVVTRKDGTTTIIESNIKLIHYEGKEAASVIVRDITDRKRTEEKYRQLLDDMNDGYGVIQDGKYVFANRRLCEIFGYEPDEIIGKPPGNFSAPEARQTQMEQYERVMHGEEKMPEQHETTLMRKDGTPITTETVKKLIYYEDKQAASVIIRDITERKQAEEALRESAEMLRLMFECAPYGIILTDMDNNIIDVNDQTLSLCGVSSKDEILGRDGMEFIDPPHRKSIMGHHDNCMTGDTAVLGVEHPLRRADGSHISVETSAGVLRNIDGNPVGLIAISRDITEEKQLRENKQFYINEIIKAHESERKSLARALHDDTIQELLLATHRLRDAITGNYGQLPKRAQGHLEEIRALIERTMTEVRGFTTGLRPDVLDDMGLIPALRWLTNRLSDGDGIDARLTTIGKERRLPPETELTLFRAAQETLNNVRKHARASVAKIELKFGERGVAMSISDNGRGFELPDMISQFTREQKLGLTGIAERVHLLNGRYKVESSPGKGTVVRIELDK